MSEYINKFIIEAPVKISNILSKINKNEKGIIFIVNKYLQLKGSISDGDLRRFFLKGGKLKTLVTLNSALINKKVIYEYFDSSIEKILARLNSKKNKKNISCLPLLDKNHKVIDISTKEKIRGFPLATPILGDLELSNIVDVIKSGWISSRGSYIDEFEKKI